MDLPKAVAPAHVEHLDALLVLGRGMEPDGTLPETGYERTGAAVALASRLLPRNVVFGGGPPCGQDQAKVGPSDSVGYAMKRHADELVLDIPPPGVAFHAETASQGTADSMVNSRELLNLGDKETLGILSDRMHFKYRWPQLLASLIFPGIKIMPIAIPRPSSLYDHAREMTAAWFVRHAMRDVSPGDIDELMSRQTRLKSFCS